jgi:hypothetical protein
MFVLDQSDSYLWPVSIELPADGRKKAFTFDAEFLRLPQEQVEELRQRHSAQLKRVLAAMNGVGEEDDMGLQDAGDETRALCDEVLCGWAKVTDAAGEPVAFNDASKRRMYSVQGAPAAIFDAWISSLGEPSEKSGAKAGGFRAKN